MRAGSRQPLREVNLVINYANEQMSPRVQILRQCEQRRAVGRSVCRSIPAELTDVDLIWKPGQRLPAEMQQNKHSR